MNVRETYALLIRIDRIFDAVACTWTGEAKGYRAELVAWSNAHDGSITVNADRNLTHFAWLSPIEN